MLYEYKIQKVIDGNGDERFNIKEFKVSSQRWWKKKKKWMNLNRYGVKDSYDTLGEAQAIVKTQMEKDAKQQYEWNKEEVKVMKEYTYTEIPNHIPEEQEENFCDLKGANS